MSCRTLSNISRRLGILQVAKMCRYNVFFVLSVPTDKNKLDQR